MAPEHPALRMVDLTQIVVSNVEMNQDGMPLGGEHMPVRKHMQLRHDMAPSGELSVAAW